MFFDKTENTVITIEGMHCNHCKARVENAIKAVKGVKKFVVSLENAEASIDYVASKVSPEDIASAVTESGFNAKVK